MNRPSRSSECTSSGFSERSFTSGGTGPGSGTGATSLDALRISSDEEDDGMGSDGDDDRDGASSPPKLSKTERELKLLQFANPGPEISNFDPGERRRKREVKKRDKSKESQVKSGKLNRADWATIENFEYRQFDLNGIHIQSGLDLCDCLHPHCPGCFFMPCEDCGSRKCGLVCRSEREFHFSKILSQSAASTYEQPFHMRRFPVSQKQQRKPRSYVDSTAVEVEEMN